MSESDSQGQYQIVSRQRFVSDIVERVLALPAYPAHQNAELITSIILEYVMVSERQWEADQRAQQVNWKRAERVLQSYLRSTLDKFPSRELTRSDLMTTVREIQERAFQTREECEHPWDALCTKPKK